MENMTDVTVGAKAPAFTAKDRTGKTHSVTDYAGKTVVLYFYPKNDTPGCTAEACDFRDNYSQLQNKNIVVLGVSPDDEQSHDKFATKYNLPFTTLADADHKIAEAYGVWGERNLYGKKFMGINRRTFIINGEGVITDIIKKVDTKNSSSQVMGLLDKQA